MQEAIRRGVKPSKLEFVPSRCDTRQFDPQRQWKARKQIREKYSVSPTERVILFVGSLSVHKGVTFLLAALVHILRRVEDIVLVVVGSGELEKHLKKLADDLKIGPKIRFCGRVMYGEVPSYMAAADVFVLPSLVEGMPRVILEAMAMELPVVATKVGGNPELVYQGETGLLVEPGNPKQLAEALLYVLEHTEDIQQWGKKARALVEKNFSFKKGIRSYAQLLMDLEHTTSKRL
jgi:glycosyltransferase involved in cell wall biosynthesis